MPGTRHRWPSLNRGMQARQPQAPTGCQPRIGGRGTRALCSRQRAVQPGAGRLAPARKQPPVAPLWPQGSGSRQIVQDDYNFGCSATTEGPAALLLNSSLVGFARTVSRSGLFCLATPTRATAADIVPACRAARLAPHGRRPSPSRVSSHVLRTMNDGGHDGRPEPQGITGPRALQHGLRPAGCGSSLHVRHRISFTAPLSPDRRSLPRPSGPAG